eukprot:233499-Chlamydomonas_euryale.AAC.2
MHAAVQQQKRTPGFGHAASGALERWAGLGTLKEASWSGVRKSCGAVCWDALAPCARPRDAHLTASIQVNGIQVLAGVASAKGKKQKTPAATWYGMRPSPYMGHIQPQHGAHPALAWFDACALQHCLATSNGVQGLGANAWSDAGSSAAAVGGQGAAPYVR